MVYESRVGDVFVLGATSWRIEDITADRVLVSPAPGQPGKLPFWHGDAPGRPAELGRALGAFIRELSGAGAGAGAGARLRAAGLDELGAPATCSPTSPSSARPPATCPTTGRSWSSGSATSSATGGSSCTRRSARGCTRRGRWRSGGRLRERYGVDVQAMHADDGIVLRLPDTARTSRARRTSRCSTRRRSSRSSPRSSAARRCSRPGSASARRARCCCRGARPGKRTPLWQQRQRAAQLLGGGEQVRLVPDRAGDDARVPAGRLRRAGAGRADARRRGAPGRGWSRSRRPAPSPFARVAAVRLRRRVHVRGRRAAGRAPRAGARPRHRACWPSCSGQADLRELLDPEVRRRDRARAAAAATGRLPRRRGRSPTCCARSARCSTDRRAPMRERRPARGSPSWRRARRAIRVRVAGERAAGRRSRTPRRLRDALGVPLPVGVPEAFLEPVDRPARRPARAGTPAPTGRSRAGRPPPGSASASRWSTRRCAGWPPPGGWSRASSGPGGRRRRSGATPGCCGMLRRRSLAAAARGGGAGRRPTPWPRFLPAWHGIGGPPGCGGIDALVRRDRAAAGRGGARVGAGDAGAARPGPRLLPALLDELTSSGEVVWAGRALPGGDGWVALYLADTAPAAAARARRDHPDPAARGGPGGARRRRRVVLPRRCPSRTGSP